MARFIEYGERTILNRRVELRGLHADGHEFPIELTVTKVPLASGPGTCRTVTARAALTEERNPSAV